MIPRNFWNVEILNKEENFKNQLTGFLKDVYGILSRGIIFQDNVRCSILDVTFTATNTDTQAKHLLSYTPKYYIVIKSNASISVYNTKEFDQSFIYVKGSALGSVTLMVF